MLQGYAVVTTHRFFVVVVLPRGHQFSCVGGPNKFTDFVVCGWFWWFLVVLVVLPHLSMIYAELATKLA